MIYLRRILPAIVVAAILIGGTETAHAAEPGELTLRVVCRANGEVPDDGALTFVLWDEGHSVLQKVINLRDQVSFAPLQFFDAGRYVYYITQEGGGSLDIVYDTTVYQVVAQVTEKSGRLTAQVAALNRVSGDPVREPEVLEIMAADTIPSFENGTRSAAELPLLAAVPKTGSETGIWLLLSLVSGLGFLSIKKKRCNCVR